MDLENNDLIKIVISVEANTSEETFEFSQSSTFFAESFDSMQDGLGYYMNILLKSMGYIRKNDFIFMESVTQNECEFLSQALDKYREHTGGIK